MAERGLPTGTVTFLFSDIEGSTRLLQQLGDGYPRLLERQAAIVRAALEDTEGREVSTEGDSFFLVFPTPAEALRTAVQVQRGLAGEPWPDGVTVAVRIGLHTGHGRLGGDNYVGLDVNRAARIAAAGHGGEVLLSDATRALVDKSLPPGVSVRDLGDHRLKDLADPERLFQLVIEGLPADFPPPRTLDARPTNLPTQLTSFVGREREIAEVADLLGRGGRLVTLTGPGGTGKTRLATEVAGKLLTDFEHGAFFVDLAPVSDPSLVASAIAEALGVTEELERGLEDTLREHLRDRKVLLVMDNFEQVLDAGSLVEDLLRDVPGLQVLVTSRAVLHREGEREYPVPPMRLPDPERLPDLPALAQFESVALFLDRATAVKPSFRVTDENAPAVAEICARLDGLPLAIELAASRIKVLQPGQILERLEKRLPLLTSRMADAGTRRRTLEGAIAWSYDLLDEDEQRLFEHVSVFTGGGTLEAMEQVCSLAGGSDTFEGLASLVDKSLIRQVDTELGEPRFVMLETIREYAVDRLSERGERAELAERHATYFLKLAERAESELTGPDAATWLERLTVDHDNIRAALTWAIEAARAELGLRLAGAVWRFWHQRAHFAEARGWFDRLLALPGAEAPTEARLKGLTGLGGIAYWQGGYPAAERAYGEAVAIARQLADPLTIAGALVNLSYMGPLRGDIPAGRRLAEEAIELFEQAGASDEANRFRGEAGYYHLMEGHPDRARPLIEQNVEVLLASGDSFLMAGAHHVLGQLERLSGNLQAGADHYREAIRLYRGVGNEASMLEPLEALGSVASLEGDHRRAVRLVGAARAARESLGGGPPPEWLMPTDVLGRAREAIGDAAVEETLGEGAAMDPAGAAAYALGDG